MSNQQAFIDYLYTRISATKKEKMLAALEKRTKAVTVVVEDMYQPQNASAVLRTCECFGVQDVHIIENEHPFLPNRHIVMGATHWLTLHKYQEEKNPLVTCLSNLKSAGYKLVATTPNERAVPINELNLDQPIALIFGTELTGISETAKQMADEFVHIPMAGFTESLNVSASMAISIYEVTKRLQASNLPWKLSEEDRIKVQLEWLSNQVKRYDLLEEWFYSM